MVTIVIPAFNEEKAIVQTIERIQKTFAEHQEIKIEILVVDDCSTDQTRPLAEKAGAQVITNLKNCGYGFSLKKGIRRAQNETIVITDADGTYPIEKIPDLLAEFKKGYHMIVGARTGKYYWETMSSSPSNLIKAPMRVLLRLLVEFTTGERIPDVNSGMRIFNRSEAIACFHQLSNRFSFSTSITLAYHHQLKHVQFIPIPYASRIGDSKVRLFRDTLRTFQFVVQSIVYYNPIKLFLVLCVPPTVIMVGALCFAIITSNPIAWLLSGISALVITVILAVGMLAELLRQLLMPKTPKKSDEER